jgi:hypothetical protein
MLRLPKESDGAKRTNMPILLERLHHRRRRRILLRVAKLLAELDAAAERDRPAPIRAARVSVGSAR